MLFNFGVDWFTQYSLDGCQDVRGFTDCYIESLECVDDSEVLVEYLTNF